MVSTVVLATGSLQDLSFYILVHLADLRDEVSIADCSECWLGHPARRARHTWFLSLFLSNTFGVHPFRMTRSSTFQD